MSMRMVLVLLAGVGLAACSGGKTIIRSEPPTAFVTINGISRGVTPLEIKLDCGETRTFTVVVSSPGYIPLTKGIECRRLWGAQKNVFFDLKPGKAAAENELPAPPTKQEDFGTIRIRSTPPAADVYLNDSFIGTTPLNDQTIKSGTYVLEVRKAGFKSWRETIKVTPRTNVSYAPILEEE